MEKSVKKTIVEIIFIFEIIKYIFIALFVWVLKIKFGFNLLTLCIFSEVVNIIF